MALEMSLSDESIQTTLALMDLADALARVQSFEQLEEHVLSGVARMMHSGSAFLYVRGPGLDAPRFLMHGVQPVEAATLERFCSNRLSLITSQPNWKLCQLWASSGLLNTTESLLFPLFREESCIGLAGFSPQKICSVSPDLQRRLMRLLTSTVIRLVERAIWERQRKHLSTYLTVSSLLPQPLGLDELIETILGSCIDAVGAEEASVLLLDDERRSLYFYQVEGLYKPVSLGTSFPASEGIAASVLHTLQAEIVNDVQSDPRFYAKIDAAFGFQTRSMIVAPLVAGEERIGVLEVLNKRRDGLFTQDERVLMLAIAEEISFAIQNARIFEHVVNSYCKQRQGLRSCRGCKRPLGSWTPCLKHREHGLPDDI